MGRGRQFQLEICWRFKRSTREGANAHTSWLGYHPQKTSLKFRVRFGCQVWGLTWKLKQFSNVCYCFPVWFVQSIDLCLLWRLGRAGQSPDGELDISHCYIYWGPFTIEVPLPFLGSTAKISIYLLTQSWQLYRWWYWQGNSVNLAIEHS